MKAKKDRPPDDELRRLIQAQQEDARTRSVSDDDFSADGSAVTPDGAIRAHRSALRDLVSPAPDEVLTHTPEDETDDAVEQAPAAPSGALAAARPASTAPPRHGSSRSHGGRR